MLNVCLDFVIGNNKTIQSLWKIFFFIFNESLTTTDHAQSLQEKRFHDLNSQKKFKLGFKNLSWTSGFHDCRGQTRTAQFRRFGVLFTGAKIIHTFYLLYLLTMVCNIDSESTSMHSLTFLTLLNDYFNYDKKYDEND